ncbi:uncharacterized protein METZ01_LOCUS487262, partial [marine metagenome]
MIVIDFDSSEGEFTIDSEENVSSLLMSLEATLLRDVWEGDISDTSDGGISIAFHVVIEHFNMVMGFLRSASSEGIQLTDEARGAISFIRDLLEVEA